MSTTTASASEPTSEAVQLTRVLCGVDASRADADAVRQAAVIAGSGGHLDLVCVTYSIGVGATAQATITPARAERALKRARSIASELGTPVSTRIVHDPDDWAGLAGAAADRDLLVIGSHGSSRAGGIAIGRTTTRALHESTLPVLIARRTETEFPRRILLASDGAPESRRAAVLAATIARAHSAGVMLVTVGQPEDSEHRRGLAEEAADLFRACGVEPTIVDWGGSPSTSLVEAAGELEASLLVLGSGGKHGVRALGSVSEQVAHHARCSVLVARGTTSR